MGAIEAGIQVTGLKELRRELKLLEGNFPRELQKTNKFVAESVIVPDARAAAEARTNPRVGRAVVNSIRATATQTRSQVAVGGAKVPWALGHEFGGKRFKQFPRWRGNKQGSGYFLYPTVRAKMGEIVNTYDELVGNLTMRAFPG